MFICTNNYALRWEQESHFARFLLVDKLPWDLQKLYAQRQEVHDSLEEKLGAIKCESGNVEVQWNNIKKCVCGVYEWFCWKSQEENKKAMDYTGDDQ
jgi:hypothetical protein